MYKFKEGKLMDKNNERELLPDVLRGFAVILVVLGHCIQEGSGLDYRTGALYFSDRLYQFIYSFHMPLFMLVSGYLSWGSIAKANDKDSRRKLLGRRASTLLAPVFLWTAVDYARILITNHINGTPQPEAVIFVYFYNALNNLWFLWAVWWCFLAVYITHYFLRDSVAVYVIMFALMFVIPDGLGMGAYKYMMPYFISAYYFHGYILKKNISDKKNWADNPWSVLVMGVLFLVFFAFYNENSFIYLTGYKLLGKDVPYQLGIDIYRTAVGFAGSGFFILLWKYIIIKTESTRFRFKLLARLGADSMGIYILSGYLLVFFISRVSFIEKPSYLINILETIVVLAVSMILTIICGKIPVIKKFVGK
jgi:fucose 4-O-acetylase-like acetyltransferase